MIAHHEAHFVISSICLMSKYSSKTNTGGHEKIPKCLHVRSEIGTFSRSLGSGQYCTFLSKTYRTI
jgi:hypothetical protein